MIKIGSSEQQKYIGSPKGEVGEIDTRAPFESVKAAVNLFGEVAISKDKVAATTRKSRLSSEVTNHMQGFFLTIYVIIAC